MEVSTGRDGYATAVRSPAQVSIINDAGQSDSAVSWSAIFAGAAAAIALSLILLILGTGLGLSSVSPWAREGASATAIGVSAIVWLAVTQILASGMGGYISGRLRTKWTDLHGDEVHFRDTAHGLLAWAVATIFTAALLTSVIGSIVSTGVKATASVADGAAAITGGAAAVAANSMGTDNTNPSSASGELSYFIDSLFRKEMSVSTGTNSSANAGFDAAGTNTSDSSMLSADANQSNAATSSPTGESARIFMSAIGTGTLPPADVRYLGQLVAQRTGLSQPEAEQRITSTFNQMQTKLKDAEVAARAAADKARKASANTALWLFVSLLMGAFVASLAATFGGRQRQA